jgi:hypothetical protein
MRNREGSFRLAITLGSGVIAGATVLVLLTWPPALRTELKAPAIRSADEPARQQVQRARPRLATTTVLASTQAARATVQTSIKSARKAPKVLPDRLDAVPSTPWREAQLARYTPQQRAMLDYKLGVMARMRDCAATIESAGSLDVFLHYKVDARSGTAVGGDVEPLDSNLNRDSDAAAIECIRKAHANAVLPMLEPEADQGEFHWATEFVFPLEHDRAYEFFDQ